MKFDLSMAEAVYASNVNNFFPSVYAYADPVAVNNGLLDKIVNISLVCDKSVGGIASGEELLSGVIGGFYYPPDEWWTINEWTKMLNNGESKDVLFFEGNRTYYMTARFTKADVVDDDYTFTFRLSYASGENPHVITFPPIRLMSL